MHKSSTRVFLCALFASSLFAAVASPALAGHGLAASWLVTYYLDPNSQQGSTVCVNFNETSDKQGVITGTWNSPSISGWSGQWVAKGQHFQWYGAYNVSGQIFATADAGDFITKTAAAETSATVFRITPSGPVTVNTGTAVMTAVKNCNGR